VFQFIKKDFAQILTLNLENILLLIFFSIFFT